MAILIDDELSAWDEVRDKHEWGGLLLGNGASRAIWDRFGYTSLYENAKTQAENPLTGDDQALFDGFDTTNFELVLSSLATAQTVNSLLGVGAPIVDDRYRSIQAALVQAVRDVHLPWNRFGDLTKQSIKDELRKFQFVYSTNYDLLLYWSINHNGAAGFKDFFWPCFKLSDTEVRDESTQVLYLHGGIHLYRRANGTAVKYAAPDGQNLLRAFGSKPDRVPLFVAEGSPSSKLSTVLRSDYLGFAYSKLMNHRGPLVIFGSSLDERDNHIIQAINKAHCPAVAVSLTQSGNIRQKKAHVVKALPNTALRFFDAATHPLGAPGMKVAP